VELYCVSEMQFTVPCEWQSPVSDTMYDESSGVVTFDAGY